MVMEKILPYLVEKPWGGEFLGQHFRSNLKKIGEAWLLSTLPEGESQIDGGPLSHYLGGPLPYLIKILDTQEPLSVQVHPNDEWATKLENSKGKTECWLILNTTPGAGVYLGLNEGVDEEALAKALRENTAVEKVMKFHPVKRGDFISVPAGTIHAIGAGVTLLEVQQASGITYRLWDWNRPAREMHIEKGLKVANFQASHGVLFNIFDGQGPRPLLSHKDFSCAFGQSSGEGWFVDLETLGVRRGKHAGPGQFVFVK